MENENLENDTPKNEPENVAPEPQPEKTEDKSKDLQSALAQKEHFREKAEKAEKELTELKKNPPKEVVANPMPDSLEIVKLGKALSGFDEEETSFIIRNAKDKSPQGIIEASKDEWVQTAIQAKREKVAKEKQILGPSSPGSNSKFTAKSPMEIAKMPKEEYDKYLEQLKKSEPSNMVPGV